MKAVVAGHLCLDIRPALDAPPDPGAPLLGSRSLLLVGPATFSTGGAVANTGLALHRLGVPVTLVGKLGRDRFGEMVLDRLRRTDPALAEDMVTSDAAATSYSIVLERPGEDPRFLHHPGTNDTFTDADVRDERLAGADLLHFGYPPVMERMTAGGGARLEALFRRARAHGLTTSLDMCAVDPAAPAGRVDWPALLERVLPHVDIFLPSWGELRFMLLGAGSAGGAEDGGPPDVAALAALAGRCLGWGAAVVGVKLGARGIYVRTTADRTRLREAGRAAPAIPADWAGRERLVPAFEVAVCGTTGSGDCAVAGFLAALLRGESLETATTLAAAAGAASAERADAVSGLLPWPALRQRVESGWSRRPVAALPAGWRRDPATGSWRGPADRAV
ncbi:MAG: carbohydrate kinase family protein [Planctomycetes bacterium]|nr:carbohydrate kinase family protein [Planctomycetota bacterium]